MSPIDRMHRLDYTLSLRKGLDVKFIDEATISVRAGKGGGGCVSFRREKFVPEGGPDGGNGGKGGDVVIRADAQLTTLVDFRYKRKYAAESGRQGTGAKCAGRYGKKVTIRVPAGTVVRDAETGAILRDMKEDGLEVVVAKGGRGGRGNASFATSINRAPEFFTPGDEGESRKLKLELKLIADVGLVGLPNAGKSTFLASVSHAEPKIADYPFTTLSPCLGIVPIGEHVEVVIADLPGLIEGAHEGAGLGHRFLRHAERTRVLLHIVDCAPLAGPSPIEAYKTIRAELAGYSEALAEKREIVAANKIDLPGGAENAALLAEEIKGTPVIPISAATRKGLDAVVVGIARLLESEENEIQEKG